MSLCQFIPWRISQLTYMLCSASEMTGNVADRNDFNWWIMVHYHLLLCTIVYSALIYSTLLYSQCYQQGIFQSIGFKEFHDYLTAPESSTQQEKDALREKGQRKGLIRVTEINRLLLYNNLIRTISRHRSCEDGHKALRPQTEQMGPQPLP